MSEVSEIPTEGELHVSYAKYAVGFENPIEPTKPVHETLTLAALVAAGFPIPSNINYYSTPPEIWEIFRGNIWNDDPKCILFNDSSSDNKKKSTGFQWGEEYMKAKLFQSSRGRSGTITGRSHFGDLQFLHAMSCNVGEPAEETREKVLLWCEVMYKIAIGEGITGKEQIDDVSTTRGYWRINRWFGGDTDPEGHKTVEYLLTRGTAYHNLNLKYRALGSLLHIIQDSYAKGHTRRSEVSYSDGWSQLGPIKTFHCYHGQNAHAHKEFDTFNTDQIEVSKLDHFNPFWGARSAIDSCTRIIKLWMSNTPWSDQNGPLSVLEEVFTLAADVTAGDNDI
ncbi:hypothetical protein TWF730_010683 [Orbilia blumenaviensis]|uniref:Uncharacterized protein n=1 Tax=Orbilia blumenaviensis TaxID=1796055 RepID=A0AAV9USE1_9PEZI